ncbi:MAG: hypothetical protein ABIN89_15115 [Chitinophagaceae bacterium]
MSVNIKKQFGIWMDSHNAVIIGKEHIESGNFIVLGRVQANDDESNSNEKTANNAKRGSLQKFFKDICSFMQNVDEVHVTGTGTAQEQFIRHLAETPQYKNATAHESTANKMSDEKLIEYITAKFNAELVG